MMSYKRDATVCRSCILGPLIVRLIINNQSVSSLM